MLRGVSQNFLPSKPNAIPPAAESLGDSTSKDCPLPKAAALFKVMLPSQWLSTCPLVNMGL